MRSLGTRLATMAGIAIAGALAGAGAAHAAGMTDPASIDRAVAAFTGADIGQPGGARLPVDRRLRLAACPAQLDLTWYGRDQRSVQVACPAVGWRIYVAVEASAATPGASRSVAGGRSVQASAEPIVRRGETVSVVAQGGGFSLTRQGEAVEDGAQGEWIRVKTAGAKAGTIRAMVIRPGQVGVELP